MADYGQQNNADSNSLNFNMNQYEGDQSGGVYDPNQNYNYDQYQEGYNDQYQDDSAYQYQAPNNDELMVGQENTFIPVDVAEEIQANPNIIDERCQYPHDKDKLFNEYVISNNNLLSILRIKPPSKPDCLLVKYNDTTVNLTSNNNNKEYNFTFHQIFGPGDTNEYITSYLDPVIRGIEYGERNTIMCYGGKKSGKSYTIGDVKRQGILYKTIEYLLNLKNKSTNNDIEITCSGICIDDKDIAFDRFAKEGTGILRIKRGQDMNFDELVKFKFDTIQSFFTAIANTKKAMMRVVNRTVIYTFNLTKQSPHGIIESSITFVNFIASNFLKQTKGFNKTTGAVPAMFQSLSGCEISKIPHDDSILTTVLYPFLKQQGRVIMIGHIEPLESTLSTTLDVLHFLSSFGLNLNLGYPTKKYIVRNIWDEDKKILNQIDAHITQVNSELLVSINELYIKYNQQIKNYKRQLLELKHKDEVYDNIRDDYKQNNTNLKNDIEKIKKNYDEECKKTSSIQENIEILKQKENELKDNEKKLISEYSKLRGENSKLLKRNENYGNNKTNIINELNTLNREHNSLRNEVEVLNKHHISLENRTLKNRNRKY